MRWLIDGTNVFGSRPDGWWNDREGAAERFVEEVARWCHSHDDLVTVVLDRPVSASTVRLAGGNLRIEVARRSGRDAADDVIVELAADDDPDDVCVVTSDRGLRARLPDGIGIVGSGSFLALLDR